MPNETFLNAIQYVYIASNLLLQRRRTKNATTRNKQAVYIIPLPTCDKI